MIEEFKSLEQSEINKLLDAIPMITLLIAGADGNIEVKETEWAKKITNIRSYASDKILRPYYLSVGELFQTRLEALSSEMSTDTQERAEVLSDKLTELNPILSKIDQIYAAYLYSSYISFAEHVAKATGGFLSFMTISSEEKKLIGLKMIDRIEMPEEES